MSSTVSSTPGSCTGGDDFQIGARETDRDLELDGSNRFDRYQDFRPLAQGGSAKLQLCRDADLGRTVVMKTLHTHLVHNGYMRTRFLREARVTAQLQHPGTVPVYEIGQDSEGRLYFTMQRLEGVTLREVLDHQVAGNPHAIDTYNLERMLGILIRVCEVLAYAHSHGVVHRDVKPENIHLGTCGEVMLLDWGVAKVWNSEAADSREMEHEVLTDVGQHPGTPLYMSPEQIRGGGHNIDARTDVYGVGVVLYEILTLTEPHRGENVHETFEKILHEQTIPPEQRTPERAISPQLSALVLRALQKNPADRFQSMPELMQKLADFLAANCNPCSEPGH